MQNEFYEVIFYDGDFLSGPHFFKDKDRAFAYIWQQYLNAHGDYSQEELDDAKYELFNWYELFDFGEVVVRGFED